MFAKVAAMLPKVVAVFATAVVRMRRHRAEAESDRVSDRVSWVHVLFWVHV